MRIDKMILDKAFDILISWFEGDKDISNYGSGSITIKRNGHSYLIYIQKD